METSTFDPSTGQEYPSPGPPAPEYATRFNAAYYASKPADMQPLYYGRPGSQPGLPRTPEQNMILCDSLYKQGRIFDQQIDAEGSDPYTIMYMRQVVYGYLWVPAGTGSAPITSVVDDAALKEAPPAGTRFIPVSLNIKNYPRA